MIKDLRHALVQVTSLQVGCGVRSGQLEQAKQIAEDALGSDAGKVVAISCAIGAEGDVLHALRQAGRALEQEIGHLASTVRSVPPS